MEELIEATGSTGPSRYAMLRSTVARLVNAGLVEYREKRRRKGEVLLRQSTIRISDQWERIQNALDISLSEIAQLYGPRMIVRPQLSAPQLQEPRDLFVLMPFAAELKPVYDDHLLKVAGALNLTIARADDFFNANQVMSDVWGSVCAARVLIADCTGRNPNVFYELGLAHAVGKPVVLITQKAEDVPFDLRHIRYIKYEFTPRGMEAFEHAVAETLREELTARN